MQYQSEVNVDVRRRYARLLRRYFSGEVTNFQYEREAEDLPCEPAVDAVHFHVMWFLYSDLREHRAHPLSREARREIARMILFLRTENSMEPLPALTLWQLVNLLVLAVAAFFWLPAGLVFVVGLFLQSATTIWAGAAMFAPVGFFWLMYFGQRIVDRISSGAGRSTHMNPYWPFLNEDAFAAARLCGSGFLGSRDPLTGMAA